MTNSPGQAAYNGGISYLYMAAAFVVVVAGMRAAESIVNPLLLAIFLSVISAPSYFGLLKRGVSNWLALLTVVGVLSSLVLAVVFLVMGSVASFTEQSGQYQQRLKDEQRRLERHLENYFPSFAEAPVETPSSEDPSDLNESTSETLQEDDPVAPESAESITDMAALPPPGDVGVVSLTAPPAVPSERLSIVDHVQAQFSFATVISLMASVAASIGQMLSRALLVLLIVVFILMEAGSFERKLQDSLDRSEEAKERAAQIIGSVHHYIRIKTWVSLATGLLVWSWLWAWNVSHSPLWGLLAFLLNYIPNIGSILAAVPAVLVAWLEVGGLPTLAIALGYVAINTAIGNFVEPRLMGKSLGLSPLVIFFSMLFWGWVLGPTGMLLSVPLTMTARIAMDGFEDTRWLATLMGNPSTAGSS